MTIDWTKFNNQMLKKLDSCPASATIGKDGTTNHTEDKYILNTKGLEPNSHPYSTFYVCENHIDCYMKGNHWEIAGEKPMKANKLYKTCQLGKSQHQGKTTWLTTGLPYDGKQDIFPTCEEHLEVYMEVGVYKLYIGPMPEDTPELKVPLDINISSKLDWTKPEPFTPFADIFKPTPKTMGSSTTCNHGDSYTYGPKKHSKDQWEVFGSGSHKMIICKKHLSAYKESTGFKIGKQVLGTIKLPSIQEVELEPLTEKLWHMLYRDRNQVYHYITTGKDKDEATKHLHTYFQFNNGKIWADEAITITAVNEVTPKSYINAPVLTITETER